jgi:hypothetical protein
MAMDRPTSAPALLPQPGAGGDAQALLDEGVDLRIGLDQAGRGRRAPGMAEDEDLERGLN